MTWSERYLIDVSVTNTTFRDLSIVGKKSISITVIVDLDNFF